MKGTRMKLYDKFFLKRKNFLKQILKEKLAEATFETEQEVLSQFNFFVNKLYDQLFWEATDGQKSKSWFRERLVEIFVHDKSRYKEGFQVDGFIENLLPEIQQEFQKRYESADEHTRSERYFDQELAFDPDPDEIIRLLAKHDAYQYFFDHQQEILKEAVETLQKEKQLVEENHFNDLPPIQVLEYLEQLQQENPETKEPFLSEKQVYDLTNMICRNQPVVEPNKIIMHPSQKRQIEVFFIVFYKYCKDTKDAKGNKEKYISLLNCYIAQFQNKTFHFPNFLIKEKDLPLLINIHPKYLRWMNA